MFHISHVPQIPHTHPQILGRVPQIWRMFHISMWNAFFYVERMFHISMWICGTHFSMWNACSTYLCGYVERSSQDSSMWNACSTYLSGRYVPCSTDTWSCSTDMLNPEWGPTWSCPTWSCPTWSCCVFISRSVSIYIWNTCIDFRSVSIYIWNIYLYMYSEVCLYTYGIRV